MTSTIDALLAEAAIPAAAAPAFDVGAALHRLAEDAARTGPAPGVTRAAQAGQRLAVVARWFLNGPGAALHVDRLAQDPPASPVEEDQLDENGAAVFAGLLYLTGHPESAQFWWQLAAGAGHRGAAYCLHLHHLALGEQREAAHWRYQLLHSMTETDVLDEDFLGCLEAVASYVRHNGSTANGPTGSLEMEVDRLAGQGPSCIIVRRPDRQLAAILRDFTHR
ncbi:hypothetical protein ACWGLE_37610 [Streptomyces sp. NPDC055897]